MEWVRRERAGAAPIAAARCPVTLWMVRFFEAGTTAELLFLLKM
jgi:hypothetical protein